MIPPKSLSSWPSRHARRCLLKPAVLAGFALIGVSSFYPPLAIPALASEVETSAARSAIANHPNVIRLRSFVCQSFAQADIARANSYPQVNLRVNGGSPLLDRIDRFETNRRRFDDTPVDAVVGIRQITTIEKERSIIAPLVEKGYEPQIALLSIDTRLQEAMGRKELADLAATRLRSDLSGQQKRLSSLENRFKTEAETQLVEMRTLAAQAAARLEALRGKVAYADVRAPVDGVISVVHVKTIGGVVEAGAVLAEVIPFEEQVTVRAQVMPGVMSGLKPELGYVGSGIFTMATK